MVSDTCPTGIPARPGADRTAGRGPSTRTGENPSLFGLVRGLLDETRTLFRQEVRLARTEMAEKAATAGRNTASIAVGGAIALIGTMALVAAASTGLYVALVLWGEVNPAIALWLAPLIVGAVVTIIGYLMIQKGLSTLRNMNVTPKRTADSLKETGQWMHDKVA